MHNYATSSVGARARRLWRQELVATRHHSEWHQIWYDEMAERARYKAVPAAKRLFYSVPGGGFRYSKYNVRY